MVKKFSIQELYEKNFLEYASYVIKERALPEIADGLKPVQRRILFSLFEMDDSRFHKVANVIGNTMKYHPHGDAAIGDALVVLANKDYFIEKQGNFGNILTGDPASAPRYIECRLTSLAKEVIYNKEITEFIDSYDGRNKEPVTFPCKIPYALLHGAEGIAVGMSTKILPHNFCEVLNAQIAYLQNKEFTLLPDFPQGGIIDASEYEDGLGKVKIRALVKPKGGKNLVISEVPYGTSSEKLIASIEDAIKKGRIKVSSITDFTTEKINIELTAQRGVTNTEVLERLFAYTDCETTLHSNINLISDGLPRPMPVSEILKKSTDNLVDILSAELKLKIYKLKIKHRRKTLEQIFIENRIYKKIEETKSMQEAINEVLKGLKKFVVDWKEEVTVEEVEKLLEIPIKKIARFDIDKNQKELKAIEKEIRKTNSQLKKITEYTISYIEGLLEKYGKDYPRRTKISSFEVISARDIKDNDCKVFFDRKTGFIGTKVKSDTKIECSSFDKLLVISQTGTLKVIPVPEKIFCEKLLFVNVIDKNQIFNVISRDKKTRAPYIKRFKVEKYIQNKDYQFLDEGHRLENFTARDNMGVLVNYQRMKDKPSEETFPLKDFPVRNPQNKSLKICTRKVLRTKLVSA